MATKELDATEPLCDEQGPIPIFPPRAFDEHGRLIPLSDAERAARRSAAQRIRAVISRLTDVIDTEEAWREFYRGIDDQRPHRPLFEGMY
jgi:hypothetical protein